MKVPYLLATALASVAMLCGFANAQAASKARADMVTKNVTPVGSFNKVNVSAGVKVDYTVSTTATPTVTIECIPEYVDCVKATVTGGELSIRLESSDNKSITVNQNTMLPVRVTGPVLESISASSGASFELQNVMRMGSKTLTILASSGALIENEKTIECGGLNINGSSAGRVELEWVRVKGSVAIDASSASKIEIEHLDQSNGTVSIGASSSSDVEIDGSAEGVVANASSASRVDVAGLSCTSLTGSASSTASVKCSKADAKISTSSGAKVKIVNK